ncbi:tetratricopeptide repeat protein [Salinimonas sediminis]|uniref:Uncharacterized protein n=1 Tax=Salinimonas sediminis TaxID=2303538 RepID=A0A346NJ44_9ALTE|nr:hypothetical protein [Salinimonas sediminis]AXR05551.1 hypothetical protein D0Y50_03680 [Salinimonas sediminis]
MQLLAKVVVGSLFLAGSSLSQANPDVLSIQQQWAKINYQSENNAQQISAFKALESDAVHYVEQHPEDAAGLTWLAIVQASAARAIGGMDALNYAERAKNHFEQAIAIDEGVLEGTALSSLATLYHKVPGWPISFGSDSKAEKLFLQALELNPAGIDPNYFYAEYLYDEGEYEDALSYLEQASHAPARPARPLADKGRHQAIAALKQKIADELK